MIKLYKNPIRIKKDMSFSKIELSDKQINADKEKTISYRILQAHNKSKNKENLNIKFDKLMSHDITYVGIIQTARASGLKSFPIPYVLTNCHNSLCAVGGTINEDDHVFGLSAAKKYGGIYVPPHQAVIHQYAREVMAECGAMILGSDSHTRYGALGTMAVGEGGPELVKQLLSQTYDIAYPRVVAIYLENKPKVGVGPQDVALAIIKAVFQSGFVNNAVMEFVGPGIKDLSADFRIGIDVMTTETTCLSSIWSTDDTIKEFYQIHNRANSYKELNFEDGAVYDGMVKVDLAKIKPMIALPFHPSNVYTVDELNENPEDILRECEKEAAELLGTSVDGLLTSKIKDKHLYVEQGIIAGCAGGGYENICEAAKILENTNIGNDVFTLSVYPASTPIYMELVKNGCFASLMQAGSIIKTAFCGPCFGAGDTPSNNAFSIRHTTRNFPNREGSKLQNGQISFVALMDSRSIAATAANKGYLTSAENIKALQGYQAPVYHFDTNIYDARIFNGVGEAKEKAELQMGPNIKDWPEMKPLKDNVLMQIVSVITDPVTTTDELIPSGETSSYRSNPVGLAEFTLSRKDPAYVPAAKAVNMARLAILDNKDYHEFLPELENRLNRIKDKFNVDMDDISLGSSIYAVKPGDGSAREQAASCQRVLGGIANIASSYATKRYRSNLINWGMLPFTLAGEEIPFEKGDYVFIPNVLEIIKEKTDDFKAYIINEKVIKEIALKIGDLTDNEREIIKRGCLINYNNPEM